MQLQDLVLVKTDEVMEAKVPFSQISADFVVAPG
jgi:hypothetical protein